jgi:hypothetical protein
MFKVANSFPIPTRSNEAFLALSPSTKVLGYYRSSASADSLEHDFLSKAIALPGE